MRKNEFGFMGVIELLVAAIVVGVIGYIAYHYYTKATVSNQNNQATVGASASQVQQYAAPTGTTSSIDNLVTQEDTNEAAINAKHSAADQNNAQAANSAAANLGDAYNESSF